MNLKEATPVSSEKELYRKKQKKEKKVFLLTSFEALKIGYCQNILFFNRSSIIHN